MLVCARCGRENAEDARFCNACGAALTPAAALDARWELALTRLSLGEALATLERNEAAAHVLDRAAEEFVRLRVPRELERAQRLLAAISS